MRKTNKKKNDFNIKKLFQNNYFVMFIMFLVSFATMLFLNKGIVKAPYLFAEDGRIFLNQYLELGLGSLFKTYGGYFNLLSRLFALISVTMAKIFNSVYVLANTQKILAMVFSSFVCAYFVSNEFEGIIKSRKVRMIISFLSLILISNFAWLLYNGVSIHWWCGILLFLVSLNILDNKLPSYKILPILVVCILSSPSGLIIAFSLLYYILKKINWHHPFQNLLKNYQKDEIIKIIILVLALALQSYAILFITDVDTITSPSLGLSQLKSLLYYSYLLTVSSINFIFGTNNYLSLSNANLATVVGLILWLIVIYNAEKQDKIKYVFFCLGSIFFLYFMINFKKEDFIGYYQEMISTSYQVWYHSLPALIAFYAVVISLYKENKSSINYLYYSILFIVFASLWHTVNHPELETAKELASVADYVDYKSNKYAYVHISPDFLDWYVTIPVNDSYCEVNDCGSTIQK